MKKKGILLKLAFTIGSLITSFSLFSQAEDTLKYPIQNNIDPTQSKKQSFDLGDPTSVKQTIVYDPATGTYVFKEVVGKNELNFRNPSMMTLEEYLDYEHRQSINTNWKEKIDEQTQENRPMELPIKIGSKLFENIFGSDQITLKPQGSVELTFGVNHSRYDNPILPVKQRKMTRFDFQQQIQLNLQGQIGTKLKIGTSYNTQAAFDFDNISKLEYAGNEDQILQKIAVGNVSMPLPTTLIQGSQTLFGAYTQLKFGRATIDMIAASSKGKRQEINVSGKAQVTPFELTADNYESNRHYFVNMYFHDRYDDAMKTLPIVSSGVNITRLEVWITNKTNATTDTRNIIAFTDLGEEKSQNCQGNPGGFVNNETPDNKANGLYDWISNQPSLRSFSNAVNTLSAQTSSPGPFSQATHYERIENARRLTEQEYSYNSLLGFISLNMPLNNDEVIGVAYQYTYKGQTYQVGEFSTDGSAGKDAIFLKLIKPTITVPQNKMWDLMMKNVYSIGAYQVGQQGFKLNVLYNNPETSVLVPFMPQKEVSDQQLVTLIEMDKINFNNQPFSDGAFDFVPINVSGSKIDNGGTINTKNGRIYFSTVEPFGATLKKKMQEKGVSDQIINQIAFTELYDSTKTAAQQIPAKNRFSFKGEYQSSVTSDIPLNALNVPQGAVSVTAGGIKLNEGVDYTVDYNLGRVKILNSGILESNTPIKISIESNSVFGFQARSLIGGRYNYKFSKNLNVGATWMRMMERPVTQKVDFGSEPFKNNIIGTDLAYKTEVPLLTKLVDLLPVISTKEKSTFSLTGEFAHIIPGVPKAINKGGTSYVDDFEGAQSTIDLRSATSWRLASIPQGQKDLFPEAENKDLSSGFNRSRLAWYTVDPSLNGQSSSATPSNFANHPEWQTDSRMRMVTSKELFPNTQLAYGSVQNLPTLDLAFYPKERGMYNYETNSSTVDIDGKYTNPETRWGGIMRGLSTNDFEQTNIEFIQFWVLDPFNQDQEDADPNTSFSGGSLYFNIGNISEDVLPDSRKSYENGLPPTTSVTGTTEATQWAKIPTNQTTVNAFDNDPNSRILQDVGLDGYNNSEEQAAYINYVNWINNSSLSATAKAELLADVSNDNYTFYRDDNYDNLDYNALQRYKKYNGMEGNSPTQQMSDTINNDKYPTQASNYPDIEDINQDNNIGQTEAYFQYKVSLKKGDMVVGKNYITSKQEVAVGNKTETWYQFKVPLREYEKKINGIQDFRSIRFMRMFLKDFDEEVVVRFARLEFVRGEWRRYFNDLSQPGEAITPEPNSTQFTIGTVNIEENAQRVPVNYDIPPGIIREVDPSQTYQRQLNEQSLVLDVCDLKDGDAKAGYKNATFDVRTYKKLKMYAHIEEKVQNTLKDEDVTLFVRLGTDQVENYYEYELPLHKTDWGSSLTPEEIWPVENDLEIVFEDLIKLKDERNKSVGSGSVTSNAEYIKPNPANSKHLIKVKGNPNLQGIKSIMIGVRNPNKNDETPWKSTDDGLSKCFYVWVNELRLTDFQQEGGSAAVAQMQVQAADFANVNLSGNYSGVNWGSVDSKVQDRQRNTKMGFDMNSSFQLGQFLGKKSGISLPFFYSKSISVINPEYDPYSPDTKLSFYDSETRKEKMRRGQDYNERMSYNFSNVKKEMKAGATPYMWRISNFSLSYAYSENLKRDFNTNYDRTKIWSNNLSYNYSFNAKAIEPFKKVKFMQKSNWWKIVRETNFYLQPKNISFSSDVIRNYNERQIKNNLVPDYEFNPVYVKQFNWNRKYSLAYDFTKNIKGTFNASNRSLFVENNERVDKKEDPNGYQNFKDTIFRQMNTLGNTMDYTQDYSLNVNAPLDKIPVLEWVTANAKYSGNYNWQRAPLGQVDFGNTIQNNRTVNVSSQLNFNTLYGKSIFLKKAMGQNATNTRNKLGVNKSDAIKENKEEKEAIKDPEKPESEMTRKELREKRKKERKEEKEKKRKEKEKEPITKFEGFLAHLIMSVQNVSGTYALTNGTLLSGYNKETSLLGMTGLEQSNSMGGFVFGQQSYDLMGRKTGYDIADRLAKNGSLVKNENINKPHTITHNQTINFRASLQPIKDLSIELTGNRVYGNNISDYYRWNPVSNQYEAQSQVQTGTLTYSTISTGTAFIVSNNKNQYSSTAFDKMRENLLSTSQLIGSKNPNSSQSSSGYYSGYSASQQDVLIGAFLTTYTNNKTNERNINPLKNSPLPNWSVNYNGLTKFKVMKKYAKNFVVRHAYSSTVSLSGIQTNLMSQQDADGNLVARDIADNFYAANTIQNVTVTERFSPLIGFDATWNVKGQGLITKFEIKRDRTATLSTVNTQVTEVSGKEFVIGVGYKFTKVKLPIQKIEPSPVNVRFDLSIRDNQTVIRKVIDNTNQATAGQKVVSIKSSADYNIGQNLVIQFYYDHVINTPKVQTSFPTANMSTGFKLRFNLAGVQ